MNVKTELKMNIRYIFMKIYEWQNHSHNCEMKLINMIATTILANAQISNAALGVFQIYTKILSNRESEPHMCRRWWWSGGSVKNREEDKRVSKGLLGYIVTDQDSMYESDQ